MQKLKKLLKLPALCLSLVIFVTFTITLIVTCSKSYSTGTYRYEESMAGVSIEMTATLKNDNTGVLEMTITAMGDMEHTEQEFYYKVKDGNLYCAIKEDPDDYELMGEINAFEISMTNEEYQGIAVVATNNGAVALKITSIVLMSVFAACALASGIYIYLSKRNANAQPQQATETTETQTSEQDQ